MNGVRGLASSTHPVRTARVELTVGRSLRSASGALICAAFAVVAVSTIAAGSSAASSALLTSAYRPVAPCRLLDTRDRTDKPRRGDTIEVAVHGRCGVSTEASAVSVTITVTEASGPGFITVWPSGQPMPLASTSNFAAGETRANGALLALDASGGLSVFVMTGAHVVVDVSGEFVPAEDATAGRYVPLTPNRALDTRNNGAAPLRRNSVVDVALPVGVPADTTALAVTVTTTQAPTGGFVTAYAAGTSLPTASILNTDAAHQTRTVTQVVPVSAAGLSVFSSAGGHLVVDVAGYFTGASAATDMTGLFVPTVPTRVLDTRDGVRIHPAGTITAGVAHIVGLDASAVASNITVTETGAAGYVTAYAARTPQPPTPAVTYNTRSETVANLGLVSVSTEGLAVTSTSGAEAVVDVTGWFTGSPLTPSMPSPTNDGLRRVAPRGPIGCLQYVPAPAADGLYLIKPGRMQAVSHIFEAGPKGPIAVVGDSLTWGSASETARSLRSNGWGPICVDGTISRTVQFGNAAVPDGLDAVARIKASDPIWADPTITWVVALGTNDVGFSRGNQQRSDEYIGNMVRAIGGASVSWMNVRTARAGWQWQEAVFDASIANAGVGVIDWHSASNGQRWFAGDLVHLNRAGNRARADLLAAGVRAY